MTNPVYTYDANGNMQTDGTRAFTWTSFDMPLVISKTATGSSPGSGSGTFTYGAEHRHGAGSHLTTTTYYLGEFDFEKVVDSTGSTYKHYVKAGDRIVASVTRAPSTTTVIYILPDHLNSTSVVTDTSGTATFRMPYDPWGDRRSGAPGSVGASDPTNTIQPAMINRGFTGHEMLDQGNLGLVHMNGRVYDPTLARFVSADPQVQAPYSTQSFNRFSYAWNAPLDATDPSGYATDWLLRVINGKGVGPMIYGVEGPYFNWTGSLANNWYADYKAGQTWRAGEELAEYARRYDRSIAQASYLQNDGGPRQPLAGLRDVLPDGDYVRDRVVVWGENTAEVGAFVFPVWVGVPLGIWKMYQGDPWGAAYVVPGLSKFSKFARAAAAAKGENLIYRAASGTPASMTPRVVDAKGLSAADSLANALPGKNQVIDTSKFKSLCAVCDNPTTGHVSITPKDMSQMEGWISSRGEPQVHPFTQELMDAVVGTVKK